MFYKTMFKKTTFNETCLNWCEQGISLTLIIKVKEVGINVTNNARVKEKCVSIMQTT